MRDGRFTVGDFTLFAAYVGAATSAPRWLGRLLARKRTADVAFMRISTLLGDAPDAVITAGAPTAPRVVEGAPRLETLEVRGLTSLHPTSGLGVHDIDFTLRRGQVTIVTGRVGSGKSTLLKAVVGLLPIEAGEIVWNGTPVDDPATFMTPPRSAYTAQTPRLFTESLSDNILMGLEAPDGGLDQAVRLAVLEEDVERLGEGHMDTKVGTRGVSLSGGQVQRAAAARMFARSPEILVFDDASSALDVRTEHTFWERLFQSGEHTCLAVSHRLEAYRHAHEIHAARSGARRRARQPARGFCATVRCSAKSGTKSSTPRRTPTNRRNDRAADVHRHHTATSVARLAGQRQGRIRRDARRSRGDGADEPWTGWVWVARP